jgi:hypothetical protein
MMEIKDQLEMKEADYRRQTLESNQEYNKKVKMMEENMAAIKKRLEDKKKNEDLA